jgi:hypothetical protein
LKIDANSPGSVAASSTVSCSTAAATQICVTSLGRGGDQFGDFGETVHVGFLRVEDFLPQR